MLIQCKNNIKTSNIKYNKTTCITSIYIYIYIYINTFTACLPLSQWLYRRGIDCHHETLSPSTLSYIYIYIYIYIYHHHYVVPLARISLSLSRHFSLSLIASGRSSGLHPISSHSCCMYVRAGLPAFAWPYAGTHRSTSLMSSSLLLQHVWFVYLIKPILKSLLYLQYFRIYQMLSIDSDNGNELTNFCFF